MKVDTGFDISYLAPIRFVGFSPSAGPTGGGTLITVTGAGFGSDCQIVVDGQPLQTERIAATALVARTLPAEPGGVSVAVTGCDAEWSAPSPYMYNDFASPPGGVFGDEIDGQLVVSVIEAGSGARIEGATVMVGIRDDSPWVALTDVRGQATFVDNALQGPQTITAYAPERSAESIVNVDADEVTLVLNPIPSPPCDPRDPECVPPQPPPTGQIIGFLTGMVKLADPPPGAVVAAIIETTRYSSGYGNPNPGPGGVLFENGAFAITTRLGEMALVAQCGWFENYGTPEQRFVPQRIGVTRGIFIREGDPAYRTAVDCNIPLDQRVSFKLTGAPELVPEPNPVDIASGEAVTYPGYFGIDVVFSFGAEGVFETLPRIRSTEPLFTAGGFPLLSGPLADVIVSFGAGAYDHIYSAPYARSYVRRISRYDRVITFPSMLPVPEITVPSETSDAAFLGVVEWTYPDAAPTPDLYHFTVSGESQDFPRYSIFVPGHQRGLDLADFPEFRDQIGQIPAPGEPGTVLGLYVRAIDLDVFDFNAFDRYVLRGTNWNAMSLGYSTVFFTPEEPADADTPDAE
jgi:hypothetical protein